MKAWLIHVTLGTIVGVSFAVAGQIEPFGWRLLGFIVAGATLQACFIPRYPRSEAIREAFKVRKGEKIEVEGR